LAAIICGHDGQGERWELGDDDDDYDDDDDVTGRGSESVAQSCAKFRGFGLIGLRIG
jgi:hypothetical protein